MKIMPIAVALSLLALVGCARAPRVVTAITYSRDQIKFLYNEGGSQGILKCKVNPGGALSECRPIGVKLED